MSLRLRHATCPLSGSTPYSERDEIPGSSGCGSVPESSRPPRTPDRRPCAAALVRGLPAHRHRARCAATKPRWAGRCAESGVAREEIFATTKLDRRLPRLRPAALGALDESRRQLGFDHVDLFLIDWPRPQEGRYVETWTGAWRSSRRTARPGPSASSNFTGRAPPAARQSGRGTVPAVNQIEMHPQFPQAALRSTDAEHGIATEAWSRRSARAATSCRTSGSVPARDEHGRRRPRRSCLRWHIQLGNIVFPKSVTPGAGSGRTSTCSTSSSSADDMAVLDGLNTGTRRGPDRRSSSAEPSRDGSTGSSRYAAQQARSTSFASART